MAACSLFEEDEVYVEKPGKGISFGLVLENSEFLSSSEEDEADKVDDRLQKGTVRVAWHPTGKETVVAEDKVHLVDRALMPGDVVKCLVPGQDTQCGFVMNMDVRCHLHVLRTNKYIYNIDSKDMHPLQRFESGQEVLLDSWLGRIEGANYELVVVFPDGARCQLDEEDLYNFEDITEKKSRHGEFSLCLHYPGQELKGSMDSFGEAKWLHSTPRYCSKVANKKGKVSMVYVTVEKIVTKSVEVHWVFRGYEKVDNPKESVNPPPRMIENENIDRLQVLDWFNHCSIQIGDRMLYRIKNDDLVSDVLPGKAFDPTTALNKEAPITITNDSVHKNNEDSVGTSNTVDSSEKEAEDAEDADFEDVEDDSDGDDKQGALGGRSTVGRRKKTRGHKGTLRHKPGKPIQSHKNTRGKRGQKERHIKPDEVVEVEIEFTTSWATVMWQDGSVEKDVPSVNLFPVHHLDELEFFPGDFILPNIDLSAPVDYGVVVKADHRERTCWVHWFKAYDVGKANEPTLVESNIEMSVYDIKDHPDYKFRPGQSIVRVGGFENIPPDEIRTPQTIGQIYELDPNGHLVIKWADGSISQHFPQEIFIVSDEADDFTENSWESGSDYESDGSVETWETESEQEIIGEEDGAKADKDDSGYDQGALCEHKQELDSLLVRAETALARLQKHLNNFDVSISAPECFHDIIRIYRGCHDLDKILQSSFFNDPELQFLISQAKAELRHDRANKISKHLSQLFESWSKNLPAGPLENIGTVAVGGKTIRVGMLKKGDEFEVSLELPTCDPEASDTSFDNGVPVESNGATGGGAVTERGDVACNNELTSVSAVAGINFACENFELRTIKKECSEPAISKYSKSHESSGRRPSDPFSDTSSGAKCKKKTEANLVGENCVLKAAKRTKSDGYDDSGREAKKSRDDSKYANHVAQELCSKICQNLQKQIWRIHEEVNKRTRRLLSSGNSTQKEGDKNEDGNIDLGENVAEASSDNHEMNENSAKEVVAASGDQHMQSQGDSQAENADMHLSNTSECTAHVSESGENGEIQESPPEVNKKNEVPNEEQNEELAPQTSPVLDPEATSEDITTLQLSCKGFEMYGEVVSFHKYVAQESQPANPRTFRTAVRKELKLFQSSLPDGIFIKGFENRLDLYSVMILGPEGTPYEDALFLFDLMLPNDYPTSPPLCHYYSFCCDRLNPNLYEDGKVCVSLLGTWSGKGTEVWTSKSNLLQVLLSIQGLILVPEPYYNEAGYERQRGTQVGHENSRMYNEMAILKTVQSLIKMCSKLPTLFRHEIFPYLKSHGPKMIARLRAWMEHNQDKKSVECTANPSPPLNNTRSQLSENAPATLVEGASDSPLCAPLETQGIVTAPNKEATFDAAQPKTEEIKDIANSHSSDPSLKQDILNPESAYTHSEEQLVDSVLSRQEVFVDNISQQSPHVLSGVSHQSGNPVNISPQNGDRLPDLNAAAPKKPGFESICDSITNSGPSDLGATQCGPHCENANCSLPQYPIFPMSRGFCLTLQKYLILYEKALAELQPPASS